jgi:hypothetical protein
MVSTLFIIEKGIKIRNESKPQTTFLLGGADRDRPNCSSGWFLEVERVAIVAFFGSSIADAHEGAAASRVLGNEAILRESGRCCREDSGSVGSRQQGFRGWRWTRRRFHRRIRP